MYTYTVKKSDWSETSLKRAFSGPHVNKVTIFQHPTIFTDTGRDPQYSNGRICSPPEYNTVDVASAFGDAGVTYLLGLISDALFTYM